MTDEHKSNPYEEVLADPSVQSHARAIVSIFAVPTDEEKLFASLTDAIQRIGEPFSELGDTLRSNLAALWSTVTVPYQMAKASSVDTHWFRISTAAKIRSMIPKPDMAEAGDDPELEREREAAANAAAEFEQFGFSDEGQARLMKDSLMFLGRLLATDSFVEAARELILQGVVLCWGAFEVLARDCFVAFLNAIPERSLAILGDPTAKKRFDFSRMPIELLAANKFDLSCRMGTILAEQQDLSDLYSIKAIYTSLFPNSARLLNSLNESNLRFLALRRNLTVHRRAVIDDLYRNQTKCHQSVGEKLRLAPWDLRDHMDATVAAGVAILEAASSSAEKRGSQLPHTS